MNVNQNELIAFPTLLKKKEEEEEYSEMPIAVQMEAELSAAIKPFSS